MTDGTHLMLCTVFSVVAGYPDEIMREYADVFKLLLEKDHLLTGEWDRKLVYENEKKYFSQGFKQGLTKEGAE